MNRTLSSHVQQKQFMFISCLISEQTMIGWNKDDYYSGWLQAMIGWNKDDSYSGWLRWTPGVQQWQWVRGWAELWAYWGSVLGGRLCWPQMAWSLCQVIKVFKPLKGRWEVTLPFSNESTCFHWKCISLPKLFCV